MAKIVITGIKEIDRAFKQLEPKLARKVIRQSIRAALKPVASEVKADSPVATGLLRSAIKVRAGKRARNSISLVVIIGEGDFKGETFYGAFQEYGTSRQPGKHYMRRAFDTKAEAARAQIEELIKAGIEREAKA